MRNDDRHGDRERNDRAARSDDDVSQRSSGVRSMSPTDNWMSRGADHRGTHRATTEPDDGLHSDSFSKDEIGG
jgi:hypothetical protein